ncbi:succinylglutamate desuccinylase/aspartoacylase family protein [Marinobacter lutaoensis]|jgi:predicted deacylase|uniref:Succinylglutamate desuccinylase n=1 Tax=Marinobacter lutaoensis TaxID=135739 RepID=A0A1V2DP49_9GAMM|nr:succinylglutamate desuccinylase/aspartoacylase family protein [Marinobacter lutaoensis]MBE03008.1 succinylglutamate desuccinylase [Marinobacter sp.]MBI43758.1 succinylglutamate desuccinylase [Oceanospirillales bacterium]NVD35720.1 succinylglutamate desuccinylase/aspartoacylase family protein [Marinobacter lutaoensis]ONF42289.1 succinylglutamate desuccinylase [Marinobacter lutaoensis]|tara:strand:+ start:3252 stop:4625 length:1374 start_codon:yes stop_codon:yes gene_type:complete
MPHATRTPHSLPPLLLAWLLPVTTGGAWAEAGAPANAATPALAIAELAEDENVEDVEHSAPLAGGDTTADAPAPAAEAEPVAEPPARRVAPHVDLKEVAPAPAPESTPAPAAAPPAGTDTTPAPADPPVAAEPPPPAAAGRFALLGNEVLPGTSTRLAWTPNIQIAGLSQTTPVLVVNGAHVGPTLCLTAAVHGDELNGIEIVRRTLYDLDPEKLRGRVVGIPIVNLTGFHQGSRYLPDRRDLNRHFPGSPDGSLADRVAHSLFENIIRYCDMLVDIHTGSLKRTNLPQIRADMNNPEVAAFTRGFDRMAVVHSTGTPGMLRTAAVAAGIRAVTLEAGESHRIQEHQIEAGVNSLTSLMEKEGMISRMFVWGEPEPVYYDSTWVRADHGGILFSEVALGDTVSAGEILGYVADPITNAQYPIRSSADGRIIGMAVDQVVMAGFAAYHIGTEAEVPGE